MYYYSTIRLILIYRLSEGGRLSRPRHCSQCAACAQSCVSQWFSWKHKLLSAARFEPGPSRAAGKRATSYLQWSRIAGKSNCPSKLAPYTKETHIKHKHKHPWHPSHTILPLGMSEVITPLLFSASRLLHKPKLGCYKPSVYCMNKQ